MANLDTSGISVYATDERAVVVLLSKIVNDEVVVHDGDDVDGYVYVVEGGQGGRVVVGVLKR